MSLSIWLRGLLLGLSIAAPVGPIGVLCIRQTLQNGRRHGLAAGLGAATADAFYGSVAAFGLTLVVQALTGIQFWLRLAGGLFLIYLGIKFFFRPAERMESQTTVAEGGLGSIYFSTFLLTLSNPVTILSFLALFSGMGLENSSRHAPIWLVMGVFCGSVLWWLFLTGGISLFRHRLTSAAMRWVNRGAGVVLVSFGVMIFVSIFGFQNGG
jgi:threonine/homoserine/homoserine lactone efflux protein